MSEFACYCDDTDDGVYQFYKRELRTATKQFCCYECAGLISPGERYEFALGVYSGEKPDVLRTCDRCLQLREWVEAHLPCVAHCWLHGRMRENMLENSREAMLTLQYPGLHFGALRRELAIRDWPKFKDRTPFIRHKGEIWKRL